MIPKSTIGVVILVVITVLFFVIPQDQGCMGTARCIQGQVTKVVDGDTIEVDGQSIRFALVSAPELYEETGEEAREYLEKICPVGSRVLVDEDDGQTLGSYSRVVALVRCNAMILNEAVIAKNYATVQLEFCSLSEFSENTWAKQIGC